MKSSYLLSVFLGFLLAGCTVNREAVIPNNGSTPVNGGTPKIDETPAAEQKARAASGEWTAARSGGGVRPSRNENVDTFKNFQYTFNVVGNNKVVKVSLSSADINVEFALYSPLGELIDGSSPSRKAEKDFKLNAGEYRIVVYAPRRAVGKFTLNVLGINSELGLISSELLQSDMQDWGPLGGGGNVKSTKNHFYSFDVTEENTIIDFEIESADTETCLFLYNNLDVAIVQQQGSRYLFRLIAARKGTYTIMAGTLSRGAVGKYSLRVFGKVANLKRIPSVSAEAQGNWPTGRSFDTYSIQITDSNAPLDIDLSSPDTKVAIYLQNSVGTFLDKTYFPFQSIALPIESLPRGTYRIVVQTHNPIFDPGGSYFMNVFGRFTNFKKL